MQQYRNSRPFSFFFYNIVFLLFILPFVPTKKSSIYENELSAHHYRPAIQILRTAFHMKTILFCKITASEAVILCQFSLKTNHTCTSCIAEAVEKVMAVINGKEQLDSECTQSRIDETQ